MITVQAAIDIILRESGALGSTNVPLADAVGRILAEDIIADTDLPPFDRSQMDGFAVIAADTIDAPVSLNIVGESAAGHGWHNELTSGNAVRIMTGAPVPSGADAVQKVELTSENANTVEIREAVTQQKHIVKRASEVANGTVVIRSGELITAEMVATLASFGYASVNIGQRPRVAILGTGSEIVDIAETPGQDQIRNSNSVMLDVFCRKLGAETTICPIVKDDIAELKSQISNAAESSDILIITGGVSVGKYDHTKTALAELGAQIFVEKVRVKPGKPCVFARLNNTLIFGLPGNPISAAVTFQLFVRPALLTLQSANIIHLLRGHAVLGARAKAAKERDTYLPAALETDDRGQLIATSLKWLGSSDFIGYARAAALIKLAAGATLDADEVSEILFL